MADVYARRSFSPAGRTETNVGRPEDGWNGRDQGGRGDPYRRPHDRRPRGGRTRSRSPMQIDRYQPGRRDDGPPRRDDFRRRSPTHSSAQNIDRYVPGQDPPAPIVNPLPNPLTIDYPVGFNFFAEWWRKDQEVKAERERQKTGARKPVDRLKGEKEAREEREKERAQIQVAYDEYKEKLQAQMAKSFVQQHKSEEWFKERYDSEVSGPFRERQSAYRRGNYAQWESDLSSGVFDNFTLEGIYKNDSDGAGGTIIKEEGETAAAAEVLGVGDLVPSKGGDLRDEAALRPTLLIKTIAPHVSREKMELFCKEHLGEGEGGFKWLSLSEPNPQKKCHRIGWVLLNPGGEVVEEVKMEDRGDGRDEEGDAEDGEDKMETETTNQVTHSAAERAVSEINGKPIVDEEKGNFTCHVGVHNPPSMPRKRALWDLFSAPERVERDLQLSMRLVTKFEQELGDDINGVNKIDERVEELRSQGALQPVKTGAPKPPKDEEAEDGEDGEDGQMDDDEDEGVWDEETDDEELVAKKKKLDILVEYLRRVFNFCFFCVFESDSCHELARKCPGGHLRRPRASLTTSAKAAAKASAYGEDFPLKKQEQTDEQENEDGSPKAVKHQRFQKHNKIHQQLQRAFNWVKTYEDKLFQILEPEAADLKKLGGRPLVEALDEELKKYVKQEDEAKFRCKVPDCTKLFKGENFWRKHVEKRHTEWFDSIVDDIKLVNAYVLDPAHITPFRNEGTTAAHFGASMHMPTGTPRGFNLQNMPFNAPPMMTGMPNPGAFGMNLGPFSMPMPGAFGQNGMSMGMDGGGVGPMRRGGGRFNNRTGPYDRQNKDNRGPRYGGPSGRLTPPRSGRVPTGPPRFPDAIPAAAAPKEAVAGRSLKSYDDLDAVGGSGDGQLDY